jgi:hypothetical protein
MCSAAHETVFALSNGTAHPSRSGESCWQFRRFLHAVPTLLASLERALDSTPKIGGFV